MSHPIADHRIGALSALSGVPVSTLRVWELRHGAFTPSKTEGRHRLDSDEDALRASLIRQLTDRGHSISTLAPLTATQLNALVHQQRNADQRSRATVVPQAAVTVAVVGVGMAARMAPGPLLPGLSDKPIQITEILEDLHESMKAPMDSRPQALLVRVNSLHALAGQDIQRVSFEQYSQECLNKSAADAHLHAYLSSVSGSARALFEKALEMVAQHENIPLPQMPSWRAQAS
ncbi:MAG: MerR family transcriptional regulator [Limnohabitans sp.]